MGKKDEHDGLKPVRIADVPLEEVSGICLRREVDGGMSLVAIGDRAAVITWSSLPDDDEGDLSWHHAQLSRLAGTELPAEDPQLEAVCADGAGRVLLLQEAPPRAEVFEADRTLVCAIALDVPPGHQLAEAWDDPEGSRGEGAVLLANGHLLVAKEKGPPAFIEFGPAGETASGVAPDTVLPPGATWPAPEGQVTFEPLATWMLGEDLADACRDLSDLEVGPDGQLYVLSDASASIARLDALTVGTSGATAATVWRLRDLDGKPEGLAFTANGRAMVALDTKKARHNIALVEPPIAPPG